MIGAWFSVNFDAELKKAKKRMNKKWKTIQRAI
jgi:hypothetical protein